MGGGDDWIWQCCCDCNETNAGETLIVSMGVLEGERKALKEDDGQAEAKQDDNEVVL